jgi:hypothetical protein
MIQSRAEMRPPRIIFNIPEGREQVNPSPESLRELVLNRGDEFWAAGSGQGALEFSGAESGSRLLLMGLENAGFFLIYEPSKGDSLASIGSSSLTNGEDTVPVYVGGEPMEVPRRNFLDKETTWRVIGDFLQDGRLSPRVKWEPWR